MVVISTIVLILLFGTSINVAFIITYNFLLHFLSIQMPNFINSIYSFLMKEIYVIAPVVHNFLVDKNNFYYTQGIYLFILTIFIIIFSFILYKTIKQVYFVGYFFKFLILFFLILNVFIGYVFSIINISILFLMLIIYTFIIKNKKPVQILTVKGTENNKGKSKIHKFERELSKLSEQVKITDQNDINKYYAKIGIVGNGNNIQKVVVDNKNDNDNSRYLHISNEIKNFNNKNIKTNDTTNQTQRNDVMKKSKLSQLKKMENEIFELNSELQKLSKDEAPNLVIKTTNKINSKVDDYNLLCRKLGLEERILPKYKFDTPIRPKLKTMIDYKKITKNNTNDNKSTELKKTAIVKNNVIAKPKSTVNVTKKNNKKIMNLSAFDLLGEITNERLITIKEKELNSKKNQDLSQTTILENPHIYSENQIPETKIIIKNRNVKGTKEYVLENNPLKIPSKDKVENVVVNEKELSDHLKEQNKLLINKGDLNSKETIVPVTHRKELDIKIENKKNKENKEVKLGYLDNSSMLDEYWEGLAKRDKKSNFKKADEKEIEQDAKKYSSFKKPEIFQTSILNNDDKKDKKIKNQKTENKIKKQKNTKPKEEKIIIKNNNKKPPSNIQRPTKPKFINKKPSSNISSSSFSMSNNNEKNNISKININIDEKKLKEMPYLFSEIQNTKNPIKNTVIKKSNQKTINKSETLLNNKNKNLNKENISSNSINKKTTSYQKPNYIQQSTNLNNSKLLNQKQNISNKSKEGDNLNKRDYQIINNKVSALNDKIAFLSKQIETQNEQKGNEVNALQNELRQIVKNLQEEVNKINNDGQRIIDISTAEQKNTEEMKQNIFDYNHLTLHSIEKYLPEPIPFNSNCKICIKNKK